jgi:hypothetical protein
VYQRDLSVQIALHQRRPAASDVHPQKAAIRHILVDYESGDLGRIYPSAMCCLCTQEVWIPDDFGLLNDLPGAISMYGSEGCSIIISKFLGFFRCQF